MKEIFEEDIEWRIEPILRPYDKILSDDVINRIVQEVMEMIAEIEREKK